MPDRYAGFRAARDVARAAQVLVCITFHFRPNRLSYLFETVRGVAAFAVGGMQVIIVTNTVVADELAQISEACSDLLAEDALSIRSFPDLEDPWRLSWCHKPLIITAFLDGPMDCTHLIYLEDDISFSFSNFCYFLAYREKLGAHGLLPSFIRYEVSAVDGQLYATDQFGVTPIETRRHLPLDGYLFMNLENPFSATFVMDRALAVEYVQTRSFDFEQSKEVFTWATSERAAMGLCWEAIPEGFYARYVVPVDPLTWRSPRFTWIHHLANTYVDKADHPAAKLRMEAVIAGPAGGGGQKSRSA